MGTGEISLNSLSSLVVEKNKAKMDLVNIQYIIFNYTETTSLTTLKQLAHSFLLTFSLTMEDVIVSKTGFKYKQYYLLAF